MGNGKDLSDEERVRIRSLREVGNSIKDIVRRFKCSRTCVGAVLKLQRVKSTTGRPTLITSRDLWYVVRET